MKKPPGRKYAGGIELRHENAFDATPARMLVRARWAEWRNIAGAVDPEPWETRGTT